MQVYLVVHPKIKWSKPYFIVIPINIKLNENSISRMSIEEVPFKWRF